MSSRLTKRVADLERSSGTDEKGPEIIYRCVVDPPCEPAEHRATSGRSIARICGGFDGERTRLVRDKDETEAAFERRARARLAELKQVREENRKA